MASIELTPEEVLVVIRSLAIEALRQRQLSSLEGNKRNVDWSLVNGHLDSSKQIEQLKERIIADATTPAATEAATASAITTTVTTATDSGLRPARRRRAADPR